MGSNLIRAEFNVYMLVLMAFFLNSCFLKYFRTDLKQHSKQSYSFKVVLQKDLFAKCLHVHWFKEKSLNIFNHFTIRFMLIIFKHACDFVYFPIFPIRYFEHFLKNGLQNENIIEGTTVEIQL